MLIFTYMFPSPEGQMGEDWELPKITALSEDRQTGRIG
jgi:hypothetical protein